jgi:RNA polymerase sigma factor (sigma-70 family)
MKTIEGSRIMKVVEKEWVDEELNPELLRTYCVGEVYAYLSRRLPRREDAEDLALEVFAAAYQAIRKAPTSELRAWIFGIARRKVADYLRRRSRRKEAFESNIDTISELPGPERPDKMYLKHEAIQMLRQIVDGLPEEQKEALLLQHLEGLSIIEISVVLEKTPAAVNSLLQRARTTIFSRGKNYFAHNQEVLS